MLKIAAKAGVHATTVSLAMRDSPRLPEKTRKRIKALAHRMGWRPDPALSALNAYRKSVKTVVHQATVGFINNYATRQELHINSPAFHEYFLGATARAEELGYKLEEVCLHATHDTPAAIRRMLLAKNIEGLLVAPQPFSNFRLDFPWMDFSAVTFGYTLTKPQLHLVTNHQYRSMLLILKKLRELGYRRIGLYITAEFDARVCYNFTAAYHSYDSHISPEERVISTPQKKNSDIQAFLTWVADQKPDVVILQDWHMWNAITASGRQLPYELGAAFFNLSQNEQLLSGIYQNDLTIGRSAFDFLISMMHRQERGVPTIPQSVLVDSVWLPGKTVRRVGDPIPWFISPS